MDFSKITRAEIDLNALSRNISEIRRLCPNKEIMAVVKANAYGHGDRIVCEKLKRLDVKDYAVSSVFEAAGIRDIIPGFDILIFGATAEEFMPDILWDNYIQSVSSVEYAQRLSAFAKEQGKKIRCHIKVNSGMNRGGIDAFEELKAIMELPALKPEALFTHFASADSLDGSDMDFTRVQHGKLAEFALRYNLKTHSQNSGGTLYHTDLKADMVRVGVAMYGYRPNTAYKSPVALSPVMSLKTVINQIRELKAGGAVSYGRTYTANSDRLLALIPIGYADGYSRRHSNKGKVWVNGGLAQIRGRVCMNQTVVDVTDIDNVKVGDEVHIYSDVCKETGIEHIADLLDTIPYEVTCAVGASVLRVAVET